MALFWPKNWFGNSHMVHFRRMKCEGSWPGSPGEAAFSLLGPSLWGPGGVRLARRRGDGKWRGRWTWTDTPSPVVKKDLNATRNSLRLPLTLDRAVSSLSGQRDGAEVTSVTPRPGPGGPPCGPLHTFQSRQGDACLVGPPAGESSPRMPMLCSRCCSSTQTAQNAMLRLRPT